MTNYLLHQRLDGTPVGVFSEKDSYYEEPDVSHRGYGRAVVASRGPKLSWEEFIEQQASKTPGYRAQWDVYEHEEAPLEDVLQDARRDTSYPE